MGKLPRQGTVVSIYGFAGHTQCRHHDGRAARDNTYEPDFVARDSYLAPKLQFADPYFRTVIVFRRVISGKFHSIFSWIFHSTGGGKRKSIQASLSWAGPGPQGGQPPTTRLPEPRAQLPQGTHHALTWVCGPRPRGGPAGIHGTCSDAGP